jgi:hypothetical protein
VKPKKPEATKQPKRYSLAAVPVFTKEAEGVGKLSAMLISATCDGKQQTIRHAVTRDQAETLIGLLVDGIQKGINTFHGLLRGEPVALGRHTADQLIEFGLPFRDLER